MQGDARPYAKFLVETTKAQRDAADATELVKDLESYAYYLSALVEKKRLLSNFGGDSVRGITAKERIENTSQRVGLRLPGGSFQSAEAQASMTARPLRPGGLRPRALSLFIIPADRMFGQKANRRSSHCART